MIALVRVDLHVDCPTLLLELRSDVITDIMRDAGSKTYGSLFENRIGKGRVVLAGLWTSVCIVGPGTIGA
jgi:hypothetical protein